MEPRCYICDHETRLVINKNNATGEVRALVCTPCNSRLGLLESDPQRLKVAKKNPQFMYWVNNHYKQILSLLKLHTGLQYKGCNRTALYSKMVHLSLSCDIPNKVLDVATHPATGAEKLAAAGGPRA